jgi:hypothetical protein
VTSDIINGLWELGGGLVYWKAVMALHRDKEVKGYDPLVTLFFFGWGFWNCFFYPANGLWASFFGGVFLALTNLVYLCCLVYYIKVRPWAEFLEVMDRKNHE